ncbi:MAG: OmpA family protein [Ignavibacteriaceae bacterium]|nr:OmpA family protein [Ignavibacteriaceae bacterium]
MKVYFSLLITFVFNTFLLAQPIRGVYYHAFSNTVVLSVEGAATWEQTDYSGNTFDYLGKASLEYFLPSESKTSFGLRGFAGSGFISGKDYEQYIDEYRTTIKYAGGGIVFIYSMGKRVFPYFMGGLSYLWFSPKGTSQQNLPNNAAGVYKKEEINYNVELGIRFLLTDDFSFNVNGMAHISPNDYLDDYAAGLSTDLFYSLGAGFSYSFFSEKDEDADGVLDSKDFCSATPKGVKVDDYGCPVDSDRDGVADYLDKCPDTPSRVLVDENGCPFDGDKDGVPDFLDQCANTPANVQVDKSGCPQDSDNDGVPDYIDNCPNTLKGTTVDITGCSIDTDNDGVINSKDQCPDTPAGKTVNEYGCEVKEVAKGKEVTLSSGTTFAFGQSTLLPTAYPELDKLVKLMIEHPNSRWRIEGHTDNYGPDWANKKISQERAESVLRYFVSRGIPSGRFEVIGLGKDFPIADNLTSEGMALNRRVVIKRID